jgi:hypothetical protein
VNVEISFEGGSGTVEFSGVQISDSDANALTLDIGDPIAVSGGGGEDMDVTGNWAADDASIYIDYMGEWMMVDSSGACDPFEDDGEMHYMIPNVTVLFNEDGTGSWYEYCIGDVEMYDLSWTVDGDQLMTDFVGCDDEDGCPPAVWTVDSLDEMYMNLSVVVEFEDDYYPVKQLEDNHLHHHIQQNPSLTDHHQQSRKDHTFLHLLYSIHTRNQYHLH